MVIANLKSEGLHLQIKNVVQYDEKWRTNISEGFDISLKVKSKNIFSEKALRDSYVLCGGNIEYLIHSIEKVLNREEKKVYIEFMEPNFEFDIRCVVDKTKDEHKKQLFPQAFNESLYELTMWVNSGNWTGIYSGTAVGARFCIWEKELVRFLKGLKKVYEHREIINWRKYRDEEEFKE